MVRDPASLAEANVTASLHVATTVRDTSKLVRAQHDARDFALFDGRVGEIAADAVFSELELLARQSSASLLDVTGPVLRPKLEAAIVARLARDLAELGLGVAHLERVAVALDAATEAWMRARRASSRPPPAAPLAATLDATLDASTELAAACNDCGAQVSAQASACPRCGGSVGPAMTCPRCGTVARPASRFCVTCGAAIARG